MTFDLKLFAEIFGGAAGAIVLFSTLPAVLEELKKKGWIAREEAMTLLRFLHREGQGEALSRLIMAIGNGFLLAASLIDGPILLALSAGFVMAMNLIIYWLKCR